MNAYCPQAYTIPGINAMQTDSPSVLPLAPLPLAPGGAKAVDLHCDGGRLSSDAGLVLLRDPDEPRGFTRALAAVLKDPRAPRRVDFTLHDLLQQRVLQMAAGYEEANDATPRRDAPICQLRLDRLPESGPPLASPPTLSRFANRVARTDLYRMALALLHPFLASSAPPPKGIVLDVDDTEDPVHGGPDQARFDGYEGGYGFLPFHVYAGLSGRLSTTILKAKRCTGAQRLSVLKRMVKRLRHAWPDTLLLLRGDRPFASPEVRQWLAAQAHLHSVTGLTRKAVLQQLAHEGVAQAKRAYERAGGKVTRLHSTRYQAQTWSRPRRVVIKVEVSEPGVHTRFVVTDREQARTTVLYQKIYGARGQAENEMKDHKVSLKSDRTSCHRFEANQFRGWLHAAASV